MYEELKNKLKKPIYQGISAFKTYQDHLECGEENFKVLSVLEQSEALIQILKFFKCNADNSDLTLIGRGKNATIVRFKKNITSADFKIISKSPAGLTERIKTV